MSLFLWNKGGLVNDGVWSLQYTFLDKNVLTSLTYHSTLCVVSWISVRWQILFLCTCKASYKSRAGRGATSPVVKNEFNILWFNNPQVQQPWIQNFVFNNPPIQRSLDLTTLDGTTHTFNNIWFQQPLESTILNSTTLDSTAPRNPPPPVG